MINNKEWIRCTLSHQKGEKVPYNFMLSPPIQKMLEEHYKSEDIEEKLKFPIRMSAPNTVKPLYAHPDKYGETIKDEFGVVWSTSKIDRGSPIVPSLSVPDLSTYRFPDAAGEYRFEGIGEWCLKNSDNFTIIWVGDLWERAAFMRGMENILLDLSLKPEFVEALLRGITDYILETMQILFNRYQFDGIAVSDDYGTQKGMLMSPENWRFLIKPCLADIYSFAKEKGRSVLHHSCGSIKPIIPDLIEIGLDILHPIQPEAMDIFELKREFGSYLTFCGGLGTQSLLPYGSPEQVRDEVKRLKREMGEGGGYIIEPGITIQADVPFENLIAMIEEAVDDY